jgi:uncharacterized protein (TIGR03000 family)
MLRRWIPVLGLFALVGAGLVVFAAPASATIRDRLAARRGYYYGPAPTQATTTATTTDATTTTATQPVTTTQPVMTEQNNGRRFFRNGLLRRNRNYTTSQGTTFEPMMTTTGQPMITSTGERRSFYPGLAGTAQVSVILPDNAELSIEGKKMTSTGSSRLFVSPTLEQGKTYTYDLHAKWMENGKEIVRDRKVTFRPGEQVEIDLRQPTPITK